MRDRIAKANVTPLRQRSQYSCMSASMAMCLQALGVDCNEDIVNKVMGARPMKGASWENALACGQHYGMRCTLVSPSTVSQLADWTGRGIPVMIAWNPEGREWSHASVVFDVSPEGDVWVADPNIPDPEKTVRIVSKEDFYLKWYERWPDYLVRRPAMSIEREITIDGRQVQASAKNPSKRALDEYRRSLSNLEACADRVLLATQTLRELGVSTDKNYPLAEGIDVVASDISRWRGNTSRQFQHEDTTDLARTIAGNYRKV